MIGGVSRRFRIVARVVWSASSLDRLLCAVGNRCCAGRSQARLDRAQARYRDS
jgi:hypothetical protein